MKTNFHLLNNLVLLGIAFIVLNSGTVALAQTEITVEPGLNTLLDAVNTRPGATLILKRGGEYVIDSEVVLTLPTTIKGEKEPADTRPALIRFFASNMGEGYGKVLISVSSSLVLKDIAIIGFTANEQQLRSAIEIAAHGVSLTLDGCFFQGTDRVIYNNANDRLTIVEKNCKFFNLAENTWSSFGGGVGYEYGGDSVNFQAYNNTYFVCNRFYNTLDARHGSELMQHNSYVCIWGETYFPIVNKEITVKNNIFYDTYIKGYVGKRLAPNGDVIWQGDWNGNWIYDSLCGDVSVYPHLNDSVEGPRKVIITNNLKMYSGHVLDFFAVNNVTPQTFFNVTGYKFAEKYGWDIKDNILQEEGNTVDPQFASGIIPDIVYELMFKQKVEYMLPSGQQGPGFPYYLAWIPEGKTKADFLWPFPLNLKPTNPNILHAADDFSLAGDARYPLGDLNWYGPEVVAAWEAGLPCPEIIIDNLHTINSNVFSLRNYPNPFMSSTLISYTLQEQDKVCLTVFNTTGSKIATLVNATQSAGYHQVTFNRANLPCGIYFYKIQVGGYSKVQKMILIQ